MQAASDVRDRRVDVAPRRPHVIYTMETAITTTNVSQACTVLMTTVRGVRVMTVAWNDT